MPASRMQSERADALDRLLDRGRRILGVGFVLDHREAVEADIVERLDQIGEREVAIADDGLGLGIRRTSPRRSARASLGSPVE